MLLTVGPGQQFSTIAAAIAASHNGDTIQVQAGTYTNDFASINTDITLEGIGGMVNMVSTVQIPNGKGILVTNGNDTINNFSFSGAFVAPSDANGAGIRDQAGNLTLNHDYFFNNQNGLLGGAAGSTITINYCEFANNGVSDPNSAGYGYTHNLYVGNVTTLTINNSYFHGANIGHEIKSRALNTTIQNSRIDDGSTGTASYSIDLPNGGNALIENNVIEQGPLSQNPTIISFGEEGGVYVSTSLLVRNNTILNDLLSSSSLAIRNDTTSIAQITGNDFFGVLSSQIASGPNAQSGNQFLISEPPLDTTPPSEPQSTLPVSIGGTATISHAFLWSYDPDNTTAELTYTVDTAPMHGTILLNGAATTSFTQADLDNNRVQYLEDGDVADGDGFTFTVADPAGNRIGPEPYTIAIVNTTAPVIEANATLTASVGSSSMIWKNSLCAVALGSEPTDLRYSVLIGPAHGMLLVDGAPTDTFTQAEIDDHRVQYQNNGDAVTGDSFTFQATDATGDQTPVTTFNIAIQSAPLARPDAGWAALSDGNHTTDLALLGQYAAAGFATSPDQVAGAVVTSMPPQDGTGASTLLTIPQYSTV